MRLKFLPILTGCILLFLCSSFFYAPIASSTSFISSTTFTPTVAHNTFSVNKNFTATTNIKNSQNYSFSCSHPVMVSQKKYKISCSFPPHLNVTKVRVSFSDGRVASPLPYSATFSNTFSVNPSSGVFVFNLNLWKPSLVKFTGFTSSGLQVFNFSHFFNVIPSTKPVSYPKSAALKKDHFNNPDPRPLGNGVNVVVSKIPKKVRSFMSGVSHQSSCVSFNDLRLVSFNYYSIDGFIYRGFLVSRSDVTASISDIVSSLFDWKFPLHSAHLPDVYGVAPSGKGANDYKSMKSGNTSMFNCRYVVGRESEKLLSPHAYGRAIDINTWENPYASRTGIYPNSFWFNNRLQHPLVFSQNHKVVKLLASHGFTWGGSFKDYHHFQK
jgi:hypothetical protein